jgi:hypothetical protein
MYLEWPCCFWFLDHSFISDWSILMTFSPYKPGIPRIITSALIIEAIWLSKARKRSTTRVRNWFSVPFLYFSTRLLGCIRMTNEAHNIYYIYRLISCKQQKCKRIIGFYLWLQGWGTYFMGVEEDKQIKFWSRISMGTPQHSDCHWRGNILLSWVLWE